MRRQPPFTVSGYAWIAAAALGWAAAAAGGEVRLTNGDRLSGDIVSLADGVLLVRSAENEYRIAWNDVAGLDSGREVTVVVRGEEPYHAVVEGFADGWVVTRGADGRLRELPLSAIRALNPPAPEVVTELDRWSLNFMLGLTGEQGNTESSSVSSRLSATRRDETSRIAFKGNWAYLGTKDGISDRRIDGEGRYDYFFREKVFVYTSHRLERSLAKQLTLRYTGGLGGGYQFFESKPVDLYADLGAAYVDEDYGTDRSVSPPRSADETYVAAEGSANLTWRLNDRLTFTEELSGLLSVEDPEDFRVRSDALLRIGVTEHFSFTLSLIVDYDNTPASGKRPTDFVYTLGLAYSL